MPSPARRLRARALLRASLVLLCSALAGCTTIFDDRVARRVHGQILVGHFISEEAYQAFLAGSVAEHDHDLVLAERAYERATLLDPHSPAPRTRLGALRCQRDDLAAGRADLDRALQLDPAFGPAHLELARCAQRARDPALAREEALRALAFDPAAQDAPLLLAQLALDAGDLPEARRWLDALLVRSPADHELRAFLVDHAAHPAVAPLLGRPIWPSPAPADALQTLGPPPSAPAPLSPLASSSPLAKIDQALLAGRHDEARAIARKQPLSPAELATRALALGQRDFAHTQASLILAADPGNADARIVLLALDLAPTSPALQPPPPRLTSPSPIATLLLAEVLLRRAGADAAQAALRFVPPLQDDDLALRLRTRLEQSLRR